VTSFGIAAEVLPREFTEVLLSSPDWHGNPRRPNFVRRGERVSFVEGVDVTPEVVVVVIAVFVSGGALGAAGTLLGQWIMRKIQEEGDSRRVADPELGLLQDEVTQLARKVHRIDARLDFTEQLLGGALPVARPEPPALQEGEASDVPDA